MSNDLRKWDLNTERPKVLLLGDGVNKLVGNRTINNWTELIYKIAKDGNLPTFCSDHIPYTLLASAISDISDKDRNSKFKKLFEEYNYSNNQVLSELLDKHFDAILTTNYTYEIETLLDKDFGKHMNKWLKTTNIINGKETLERKYMLKTYHSIENNNKTYNIWHIHGELRNVSSLILTQDNYGRLIERIIEYLHNVGDQYSKNYTSMEFKSWIDYFLLGDVYVIGQGFNFSEFDLWWLLSRKLRSNPRQKQGSVYFYEPVICNPVDKDKETLLGQFGVKVNNLGCMCKSSKEYEDFYRKVIATIQ